MKTDVAVANPLNAKRFEGDSLRLQLQLETALARTMMDGVVSALEAGADPLAYPVGRLRQEWVIPSNVGKWFKGNEPPTPDRCTLLGNVAMGSAGTASDEVFRTVVRSARVDGAQPGEGRWKNVPAAYADHRGEEVSLLQLFFERHNFRRIAENRPHTTCVDMLQNLLEKLDPQPRHIRWEMREAASAALARSMDSSESSRVNGMLDERNTSGYDAFGILAVAGTTLTDDLANKTIQTRVGSSYLHVPLLTAASMPHTGSLLRSWSPYDFMGRLIEQGAKVDARSMGGRTALMYASWQGDARAVSILLQHDSDASLKDARRWTAESYAKNSQGAGGPEVLALLQAHKVHAAISKARLASPGSGGLSP